MDEGAELRALNVNPNLDFIQSNLNFLQADDFINPYTEATISSNFYDNDTFLNKFKNSTLPIVFNLNVQSLLSKHLKLKTFILDLISNHVNIKVICLQEIWQIPFTDLVSIPGFSFVYKQRSKNRGGGVGFFIKSDLKYKILTDLSPFIEMKFESLSIEIIINNKKCVMCNFYRPPSPIQNLTTNEQLAEFTDIVDNLANSLIELNLPTYILSDSNINLLNFSNLEHPENLLHSLHSNGFLLMNFKATRMQNGTSTLIDHIFSNNISSHTETGTVINDISDHFINFIQLPFSKKKEAPPTKPSRKFTDENVNRFGESLRNHRWLDVFSSQDVNDSCNAFWNTFNLFFNLHFPISLTRFNRNIHKTNDFMTNGLLVSRINKNRLHKISLTKPSASNIQTYKTYRNIYNSLIRKSRKMYFQQKLNNFRRNPKKTWMVLKEAMGGGAPLDDISDISVNGVHISDKTQMADEFNNFFSCIGKQISDSIPPSTINPLSYLNNLPDVPNLEFFPCGPNQIITLVRSFENKSSPDLDGISINLIKKVIVEIATPLSHIFTLSLNHGVFPELFKTVRVVPIFKSGDKTSCDNYRPISLVKTLSKVLEKIVQISLVNHLEINKLIYKHQYGFLRARSTEHNLIQVVNMVSQALNGGDMAIGVFLDLRKAFDVCDHGILLSKLNKYGITGKALDWFISYLTNRKQVVDISGYLSNPQPLDISTIQGSLLGPILFLVYINDFPNCTNLSSFLFADDTTALKTGPNLPELISDVNAELKKMSLWFRANKMALNISKTKYIIFHNKGKKINLQGLSVYIDENDDLLNPDPSRIHTIDRIYNQNPNVADRSFKLLGVHIDEHLNFNNHVSILCNKLSRALFILRQVKNVLPQSAIRTLYFSLFHCHLTYCPIILSMSTQTNINRIFKLQKKAIRIVSSSNHNAQTSPLFYQHGILPLEKIFLLNKLLFMHAIAYRYNLESFNNIWLTNNQREMGMELRNTNEFILPLVRRESFRKSPLYTLPLAWNQSSVVKLHHNRCTFKIALSYELFESLIT
jgi:hypothetical protein